MILLLCHWSGEAAEPVAVAVRHRHWKGGQTATLRFTDETIVFEEVSKKHGHSHTWLYDDIQQLTVSPDTIRVLTYDDQAWKLGRDREYVFDKLPEELPGQVYALLQARLDQRFIAALGDESAIPLWSVKAKLLHRFGGPQGQLLVSESVIVFKTEAPEQSRVWRIDDIDNVSSSGPFEFVISTYERSRLGHGERTDFRFNLKQPLKGAHYQDLWRRVNRAKGLMILTTQPTGDGL